MIEFINPHLLYYPYKGWMAVGIALGWINSRIILGLIIIVVLMPISFIMKFFGSDPLKIKKVMQVLSEKIRSITRLT